jgi:hypothetical protein
MDKVLATLLAGALVCAANPALAERTTAEAFRLEAHRITVDYQADRKACSPMHGNARDICRVQAKAKRRIAMADAEAAFKHTDRARSHAHDVRAEQAYLIAKEKCDDQAGAAKRDCRRAARDEMTRAKAGARSPAGTG